jgi:hypothetical protein
MEERKRHWRALNDLHAERPMVLVETFFLDDYVYDSELQCVDPFCRDIEKTMLESVRHAEEIGDDFVLEPLLKISWDASEPDFGVTIEKRQAASSRGNSLGYKFKSQIHTPEDLKLLKRRTWCVNRESTRQRQAILEDAIGDILPVRIEGRDQFYSPYYTPFLGLVLPILTMDVFKLIGEMNMLTWVCTEPEAVHMLMSYLRDDRNAYYDWMEREGLFALNNNNLVAAGGSHGYTSELPKPDYRGAVRCQDLWCWAESQETSAVSPTMFAEFFLPYIAQLTSRFGLVYYGCCEALHDRWELIRKAIPNVRSVSISHWSDKRKMAGMLGRNYIFSRKSTPFYISGDMLDWDLLKADARETLDAARDLNLEFILRDVYTINGDRPRLKRWVEMVRGLMNA